MWQGSVPLHREDRLKARDHLRGAVARDEDNVRLCGKGNGLSSGEGVGGADHFLQRILGHHGTDRYRGLRAVANPPNQRGSMAHDPGTRDRESNVRNTCSDSG